MVIELALGIVSAMTICDGAIAYGILVDYRAEKAAGKVGTFREYFSRSVERSLRPP